MIRLRIPGDDEGAEKAYARWLDFKELTDHCVYAQVLLVLGDDLPDPSILMRFFGEKVFGIQISTNTFISNSKGHPVLPESHRNIVKEYMKVQTRIILQPRHAEDVLTKYVSYLTFLFANHDNLSEDERGAVSCRNYLQSPL